MTAIIGAYPSNSILLFSRPMICWIPRHNLLTHGRHWPVFFQLCFEYLLQAFVGIHGFCTQGHGFGHCLTLLFMHLQPLSTLMCFVLFFKWTSKGRRQKKKIQMTNLDIFKSNLSNPSGKLVLSMKGAGGVIYLPGISERLRFWHQMHGHMTPSQHSRYSDILPRRVSFIELKKSVNKISLLKQPNIQACCLSWNKILIATRNWVMYPEPVQTVRKCSMSTLLCNPHNCPVN